MGLNGHVSTFRKITLKIREGEMDLGNSNFEPV